MTWTSHSLKFPTVLYHSYQWKCLIEQIRLKLWVIKWKIEIHVQILLWFLGSLRLFGNVIHHTGSQFGKLTFSGQLHENHQTPKPRNFQTNPIWKMEKLVLIINIKAHIIIILQKKNEEKLHLFKVHSNLQYRTKNSAWRIRSLCCECLREIFWKFVWFFFCFLVFVMCFKRRLNWNAVILWVSIFNEIIMMFFIWKNQKPVAIKSLKNIWWFSTKIG